jgi:hypothetical protein
VLYELHDNGSDAHDMKGILCSLSVPGLCTLTNRDTMLQANSQSSSLIVVVTQDELRKLWGVWVKSSHCCVVLCFQVMAIVEP